MSKSVLARLDSGEIQITITVPKEDVKKAYDEAIDYAAKNSTIPGFRKGKAPQALAEENIDKSKIYEHVINHLVPDAYLESLKENKLNPIISPKVELLKAAEGEDWEVRATTCEKPNVELGDYKKAVKDSLAAGKIWTPASTDIKQDKKEEPVSNESSRGENEKIDKIIQALLDSSKINLPNILVEDELNRLLSNLINQTEKLGVTIDQYLRSINKTTEQIREEYRVRVESDLKFQFILDEIANLEKVEVTDKDIEDMINVTGDPNLKESLNQPAQREYLREIIRRRKVIDSLSKLN